MSTLDEESAPLVAASAAGARDDRCGSRRRARAAAAAVLMVLGTLAATASSVGSPENAPSLGAASAKPPEAPRTCAPVTHLRQSPCARAFDSALGEPRVRLEAYAACAFARSPALGLAGPAASALSPGSRGCPSSDPDGAASEGARGPRAGPAGRGSNSTSRVSTVSVTGGDST